MKFIKFLRYDLKNGILLIYFKYLVAAALFLFLCLDFFLRCGGKDLQAHTLGDLTALAFAGMREYVPSPTDPFRFPAFWVLTFALLLYITLYYADQDLVGFGQHTMVCAGGRGWWWLSKCAWNTAAVLVFFVCAWVVLLAFALCSGLQFTLRLSDSMEFVLDAGNVMEGAAAWRVGLELTVMPVLIGIALSLLQMTLSLWIKPIFSYMLSVLHLIASAYAMSPFLIGNYAMVLRSDAVIENGVNAVNGILFAAALCILSVAAGWLIFRKYNILNKEGA